MFFEFDLSNFTNETYGSIVCILRNKIYKKAYLEKEYKLWFITKNATKAKHLMLKIIKDYSLIRFEKFRNVFVSARRI